MQEADLCTTEPPDFLTRHLSVNKNEPKELTIQFLDGSLEFDQLVICALSTERALFIEHDHVIVEELQETGRKLKDLLYTGTTLISNAVQFERVKMLLCMMSINIELNMEMRAQSYGLDAKDEDVLVSIADDVIDNVPDVNSIILSNMNQNENMVNDGKSVLDNTDEEYKSTLQKNDKVNLPAKRLLTYLP